MRLPCGRSCAFLAALVLYSGWAGSTAAADKSAADLLPGSIVGYLEVPQPGQVLGTALDHPIAKRIEQAPEYQAALRTPQYEKFLAALKHVEQQLGQPWREAASKLTSGGLYVAFDLRLGEQLLVCELDLAGQLVVDGGGLNHDDEEIVHLLL